MRARGEEKKRQGGRGGAWSQRYISYPVEFSRHNTLHGEKLPGKASLGASQAVGPVSPDAPLPHSSLALTYARLEVGGLPSRGQTAAATTTATNFVFVAYTIAPVGRSCHTTTPATTTTTTTTTSYDDDGQVCS